MRGTDPHCYGCLGTGKIVGFGNTGKTCPGCIGCCEGCGSDFEWWELGEETCPAQCPECAYVLGSYAFEGTVTTIVRGDEVTTMKWFGGEGWQGGGWHTVGTEDVSK